jgi:hypothetical protein
MPRLNKRACDCPTCRAKIKAEYAEIITANFEVKSDLRPTGHYLDQLSERLSKDLEVKLNALSDFYKGDVPE